MSRTPRDGRKQPRLFADDFDGFGPSRFRPIDEIVPVFEVRGKRLSRLKRGAKKNAPKAPGVYGMLDKRDRLIYVGKAKNLRARLLCYFRENSRDPKAGKIIEQTKRLVWEQCGDEFAALLRELELIQRLRPRYNVLGVPGFQRHHYICVGRTPAPYVYVTSAPSGKELGTYGPLVKWGRSDDAARRLNDWFKLRDCPQTVALSFAEQGELFDPDRGAKCLRFELGTCCGPCVGACSRKDYSDGVRAVKAFLDGRNRSVLRTLQGQMEEAAAAFEFEKAMSLRDKLQALQWLDDRLSLLRTARDRNSFVYPLTGTDGRLRWYLIHRGEVQAVTAPPTPESAESVSALLATTFADHPVPAVLSDVAVDSVLLVSAWFRKYTDERATLLPRAKAEEVCASHVQAREALAPLSVREHE
ncbi:excinuclease abc subunit c : Excinuclease ABC subunit C OS=Rhodopirellula maiorica SM1 GN=RMSM_06429 PE=4 SV=1: GIY-YIG: UVR [Gemmata massiliana]|uniref:GIY-YIG domain-containing protein n=1 Tax=Gemmata massiliana TaxID=1210884 RepID=A0A6P2D2Y9_9BACT|nr:GIY-YIG nuclease family protein [Gemmata massiliana]VTR95661.1 excinuclease abc subunit c : Excinuclease ABC subunit C OS=Rhodopirellula maiorica SM1 GN=RMSM_06429 PE=4 SV=1: GIY-YIG: UVR [Gemmata massiliana]